MMYRQLALKTLGNLFIAIGLGIAAFTYIPIIYSEVKYTFSPKENVAPINHEQTLNSDSVPQEPDFENIKLLDPIDPDFSIVITKIEVNAPVVENVTMIDETEYMEALKHGVAHAQGTAFPGEKGNMFLFAHSSLNFWQLGPYATVFNLLNKLEEGDLITVFHNGQPYTYEVYEMTVVPGWNTDPFYNESEDEATLTLITCDPPGSTLNRRVVKAKLV